MQRALVWATVALLFPVSAFAFNLGRNTPLTDFEKNQLYLGKFPGFLYDGTNQMPADHEKDGILAAAKIKPIQGNIVVVGIGMSNWDAELCNQPAFARAATNPKNACAPWSFIGSLRSAPNVNPKLIVVDCAQGEKDAKYWADDNDKLWTQCNKILAQTGIAPGAVQILLYKNANAKPRKSLMPRTACATGGDVDACALERTMGQTMRFAKKWYPNLQQAFVHSRIYSYGAPDSLNPEPFAYETGFACKWLIEAQID